MARQGRAADVGACTGEIEIGDEKSQRLGCGDENRFGQASVRQQHETERETTQVGQPPVAQAWDATVEVPHYGDHRRDDAQQDGRHDEQGVAVHLASTFRGQRMNRMATRVAGRIVLAVSPRCTGGQRGLRLLQRIGKENIVNFWKA